MTTEEDPKNPEENAVPLTQAQITALPLLAAGAIDDPVDDTTNDPNTQAMIRMLDEAKRMDQAIRNWHKKNSA
jgi:hypothetical protein